MGSLVSRLLSMMDKFARKQCNMVMIGLDAAGKTTVLYKLKLGETITSIPTIGFNVEQISYKKLTMTVWDIGGQDKIRKLWKHYYTKTNGVIWVIDSNDRDRFNESKDELFSVLKQPELHGAPVLVLANKMDLPNAVSASEIAQVLDLYSLKDRPWYVQPTCAPTGEGLYEGLEWLSAKL